MKYLLVFLFLFFPYTETRGLLLWNFSGSSGVSDPGTPPTYLRNQNFEGTSPAYDNSETWVTSTGVPNANYSPALLGSESLSCDATGGTCRVRSDFANQDEAWIHFLFKMEGTAPAGDRQICSFAANGSSTESYKILLTSARKLKATVSGSFITPNALTIGQTYHIFIRCKKGTGNAAIEISFSTDGSKPTSGSDYVLASGLTISSQIGRIYLGCDQSNTASPFFYDKVLIDDVAIGDNP